MGGHVETVLRSGERAWIPATGIARQKATAEPAVLENPGTAVAARRASPSGLNANVRMFFFFSNKLGCLGSIVVSLLATALLLFIFGVF